MSDRQSHRASLLLALAGAILMVAAALASLRPSPGLPNRDSSGRPSFDYRAESQNAEGGSGVEFHRPQRRHDLSGLSEVPLA